MKSEFKLPLAFLFGCLLGYFVIRPISDGSSNNDNSYIDRYKSEIKTLGREVDSLNNLIYFNECEIENLKREIREKENSINNLNHKYESELGRVKSLPTDSAIMYLKGRLNEE